MNRFHVRTTAVLLLIAFASVGAFVLTDSFVPQAQADDDCAAAAAACASAVEQALVACQDDLLALPCVMAIVNVIVKCGQAVIICLG